MTEVVFAMFSNSSAVASFSADNSLSILDRLALATSISLSIFKLIFKVENGELNDKMIRMSKS